MGISDIIIAVIILAGAVFLLYHSVRKKKGHCPGCGNNSCDKK
jgi:hypothetical protein